VYINGVQLTGINPSGGALFVDWSLGESQMASNYGGVTTNRWDGLLDQFALWSRVLNTSEIATLYNTGNGLAYINWGGTQLAGGTISPSSLTISSGQSPGTFSSTAGASGGTGSYTYQWQKSTNGSSYTEISGATTTSYTSPTLTQNTWYRRKVTDGATTVAYSNVSAITVNTVLTGGTISPSSLTINSGQSPGTISSTVGASGGTGSYTYQWQKSTNGSSYTDISGATTTSYSAPTLTQNTWYRRKVTDGASTVTYSNASAITITTSGTTCLWDDHTNYISYEGPVGINTASNPGNYELIVNGEIRAKEVVVETGWADYVFDKDYNLKSLNELEDFIIRNKHLPEIPSAKEVEANGVDLGEMNMLLLKKIEELTLYLISQQKEIEKLKNPNEITNK
jgi:hypothetical protein